MRQNGMVYINKDTYWGFPCRAVTHQKAATLLPKSLKKSKKSFSKIMKHEENFYCSKSLKTFNTRPCFFNSTTVSFYLVWMWICLSCCPVYRKVRENESLDGNCWVVHCLSPQASGVFQIAVLVKAILFSKRLAEAYQCCVFTGRDISKFWPVFEGLDRNCGWVRLRGPVRRRRQGQACG